MYNNSEAVLVFAILEFPKVPREHTGWKNAEVQGPPRIEIYFEHFADPF